MAKEQRAPTGRVTAFELDPNVAAAADGAAFPAFPGVWQHGRPVHPSALGMTLEQMREVIAERGLPLVEVHVADSRALKAFDLPPGHIPSAAESPLAVASGPGAEGEPIENLGPPPPPPEPPAADQAEAT